MEGGLASGYEKLIMDADQLSMFQKFSEGVDFSENGQAMDAIREVGPGSHYLGSAHTQANFQTAFWRSGLADNNSFEQWQDEGSKDIVVRANAKWKQMLRDYEAPALDEGIDEALLAFIAQRKAVDSLRNHLGNRVFDQRLIPAVQKTLPKPRQQVEPLVHLPQQKRSAVGTDRPPVKTGHDLPPPRPFKSEARLITLCHSDGRPSFGANCCVETQLCHRRRPFAYSV